MKHTIEFEYDIGDQVFIKTLKMEGWVSSIWITDKGIKYEVRYFWNGELKEVYFYINEIAKEKC